MGGVHGKGRFKCSTCQRGFSWRLDLAEHSQHCNSRSKDEPPEYYLLECCFMCGSHLSGLQSEEALFIKGHQKLYNSKKSLSEVLQLITHDSSLTSLDQHTVSLCKVCMTAVNKWDDMNQQLSSLAKSLRSTYRSKRRHKGTSHTTNIKMTDMNDLENMSNDGNSGTGGDDEQTPEVKPSEPVAVKQETNMDLHMDSFQECEEKDYKCSCGKAVKGLDSFVEHQLREGCKIKTNEFPCKFCGFVFSEKKLLVVHKKACVKATLVNGAHECDICGRRFLVRGRVETHKRLVHSIGMTDQQLCSYCGRTFAAGYNMKNHMAREHDIGSLEEVVCELCGGKFCDRSSLRNHRRNIHGERKHQCDTCGKKFATPGLLNHHINEIHKNTYNYQCTQCGEQFHVNFKYRYHMRKMHNTLQYACDDCGRKFIMRSDLYRHVRGVHMGIQDPKRYPCRFCGRLFPSKYKVKRHMSSHGILTSKSEKLVLEGVNSREDPRLTHQHHEQDINTSLAVAATEAPDGTSIDVHQLPVSEIYAGPHITTLTPEILQGGVHGPQMLGAETMVVGSMSGIMMSTSPIGSTISSELHQLNTSHNEPHHHQHTTQDYDQGGTLVQQSSIIPVHQMIVIQDSVTVPAHTQFSITSPSSQVLSTSKSASGQVISVPAVSSQVISVSQSDTQVISVPNVGNQVIPGTLHAPTTNFTVSLPAHENRDDSQKLPTIHYQYFSS